MAHRFIDMSGSRFSIVVDCTTPLYAYFYDGNEFVSRLCQDPGATGLTE